MTLTEIAIVCALKSVVVAGIAKSGLLRDRRAKHRAQPSTSPTAYAGVTIEAFSDLEGKVWAVQKRLNP